MRGIIKKIQDSHGKEPWFHFGDAYLYIIPVPLKREGWVTLLTFAALIIGWLYFAMPYANSGRLSFVVFLTVPAALFLVFAWIFIVKSDWDKQ